MIRSAIQVRSDLLDTSSVYNSIVDEMSSTKKGAIIGRLNEAFGSDLNRKLALSWLFSYGPSEKFSTKSLSNGDWYAIDRWLGSWRDDDNEWHVAVDFWGEASLVIKKVVGDYAARYFHVGKDGVIAAAASLPGLKIVTEQYD